MLIIVVVLSLLGSAVACQRPGDSLAESHIKANVPDQATFDVFLQRDLEQYFRETKKKEVKVQFELLRKAPTQSGTSFPKFYAWVVLKVDGAAVEEGAVRVAAVEKKRFEVYKYLAKNEIERDLENLYRVFPIPVADSITEKVAGGRPANRPRDFLRPDSTAPYMQTSEFKQAHERLESDFWRLHEPDQRAAILSQDMHAVLRTITSEKEFSTISNVRYWSAKNAPDVIPELIKLLTDARVIGLENSADLIISERIESGDLKFYGHGGILPDDIFSIAGRASWILRDITGQNFGAVSMKSTRAQLQQLSDSWRTWYEKNALNRE